MEIKGIVDEIIYRSKDSNYTVILVQVDEEIFTAVGNFFEIEIGNEIVANGSFVEHKTYGEQFKIESYHIPMPRDEEKIFSFLSSGQVTGIGKKTARKIVDYFGQNTLDVFSNTPHRLLEIKGITQKKLEGIIESYSQLSAYRDTYVFLNSLDIGPSLINRIIEIYRNDSSKIIKENPYRLCDDIDGIGFITADKVAKSLGFSDKSHFRTRSLIIHILTTLSNSGHSFSYEEDIILGVLNTTNIDIESIKKELSELIFTTKLVKVDNKIYLSNIYEAEAYVANNIFFRSDLSKEKNNNFESLLEEFQKINQIDFSVKQKEAVQKSVNNLCTIITGGPGTGKTTIVKAITNIFEKQDLKIKLCAPTGRAAKRLSQATQLEAQTIHRLLDYKYLDGMGFMFGKNSDEKISADVIIVDEFSMVDILLFEKLLKAINLDTRLVIIGDKDQLPSVGPGNVLRDLIDSKIVTVVHLDTIYRQSENSYIAVNAKGILEGENPKSNTREGDFFVINRSKQQDILNEVVALIKSRLKDHYGFDPMNDIQVLSPIKNGIIGTKNLNAVLQDTLNPREDSKPILNFKTREFRLGDKVMQMRNNYFLDWQDTQTLIRGKGVFNGEIGYIIDIDETKKTITTVFDQTKEVVYDIFSFSDLELAYAITVHKSQGSEFKSVIIPISHLPEILSSRNLLYTAVTRAKELVVIIGENIHIKRMIDHFETSTRNSSLVDQINKISNEYI